MKSNYKRLGNHIRQVKVKNTEGKYDLLLGINIDKYFMPSVANVVGTDLTRYKVVEKNQFACNRMHVGRDYRIPMALSDSESPFIVSPAYTVFQICDESILLPEYLMMWFSRPEFDRECWFHTDADVRGGLPWDLFCDIKLPIPSIEKQQEIVAEYNTVTNRIALNEQLNQKLEETAQALYKHWFVDFEFPAYLSVTLSGVEGYKSSGGKMVYNDELDKEIPYGWEINTIDSLCDCNMENYSKNHNYEEIQYLDTSNITNNKIDDIKKLVIGVDTIPSRAKRLVSHNDIIYSTVRPNLKHFGILKYPHEKMIVSTGFAVLKVKSKKISAEFVYQILTNRKIIKKLQAKAEMSVATYPSIKPEDLLAINVALPKSRNNSINNINKLFTSTYELIHFNNVEISQLIVLKDLLLSKMTKVEQEKGILKI